MLLWYDGHEAAAVGSTPLALGGVMRDVVAGPPSGKGAPPPGHAELPQAGAVALTLATASRLERAIAAAF